MLAEYIEYNKATRAVLNELMQGYDTEKIGFLMSRRELLLKRFEKEGWPESEKAAAIIQDTLELERECMKKISVMQKELTDERKRLSNKKYALQRYYENTVYQ